MGIDFQFCQMKKVLEMDSGYGSIEVLNAIELYM